MDHAADIAAPHTKHAGKLLLGHGQHLALHPVHAGEKQFRDPLFNRMSSVARHRLKHLSEKTIRIARKKMLYRDRLHLRRLEGRRLDPQKFSGEFNRSPRIGRKTPMADNAANGSLPANERCLRALAIGQQNRKGC